MAISKLNKTYASKEKLTSSGMNNITGKVDELVDAVNSGSGGSGGTGGIFIEGNTIVYREDEVVFDN